MKKTIERVSGTAKYNLPASISREIGQIIVHWAHFEHIVQEMVWQTMQVSQQVGRIAVREPRVTDRLEMLRDLVKLRNAEWNDDLFKSILIAPKCSPHAATCWRTELGACIQTLSGAMTFGMCNWRVVPGQKISRNLSQAVRR